MESRALQTHASCGVHLQPVTESNLLASPPADVIRYIIVVGLAGRWLSPADHPDGSTNA